MQSFPLQYVIDLIVQTLEKKIPKYNEGFRFFSSLLIAIAWSYLGRKHLFFSSLKSKDYQVLVKPGTLQLFTGT